MYTSCAHGMWYYALYIFFFNQSTFNHCQSLHMLLMYDVDESEAAEMYMERALEPLDDLTAGGDDSDSRSQRSQRSSSERELDPPQYHTTHRHTAAAKYPTATAAHDVSVTAVRAECDDIKSVVIQGADPLSASSLKSQQQQVYMKIIMGTPDRESMVFPLLLF